MLRRAFRGGNTHGNRCYTGIILDNITSYDRASSYPDVLVNMPYPIKQFVKQKITKPEEMLDGFPYLIEIDFTDIELSDPFYGCPYLSIHKCYNLTGAINDNGRVIKARRLLTYLTDIDFEIVKQQYKWKSAVIVMAYRSEYGLLPQAMKDVTMEYYERKTKLKGVEGQEVYYMKSKNKLNSIYGMCATNPVRTSLVFNGTDFSVKEQDDKQQLAKANKRAFTVFAWGCWCTAWARYWLEKAIRLCGYKFVYCDTDSVKFIGNVDFTELNAEIQATSEKHGAYADDPQGVRHYLGVYEHDATYKRFIQLGAKRYAYEDENGKLHITIAGVSKSGAAELGKLENFKDGFVFHESAGMEAYYNDTPAEPVIIDGHTLEIPPNIYLERGDYTLGITEEYKRLFYLTQEQLDKIIKTR
jgi:DNA polymerase elongation subunit (family B)